MNPNPTRAISAAAALAIAVFCPAPALALSFALTDLGIAPGFEARQPTYGYGLNARGDVIGQISTSQYTQTALWTAPAQDGTRRSAVYVPPVAGSVGYRNGVGYHINASGHFVGTLSDGGNMAAVYRNGGWSVLPGVGVAQSTGRAYAINDAGTIVGQDLPGNYGFPLRWLPDGQGGYTPQRLNGLGGGGIARDVNASGQIAGASNVGVLLGASHAVLWQADNTVTDLGVLSASSNHSVARALNDAGVVVGESRNASNQLEAFRWKDGAMTGLGAIPGWQAYPYPVASLSSAADVNNLGWVVGTALRADGQNVGFLWREGLGMVDLNTLISPADPWFAGADVFNPPGLLITGATAVNDSGRIVVTAVYNYRLGPSNAWQVTHAFLLSPDALPPVPEPASAVLLALGGLALAAVARRRAA
jgi:probable HAF family extracellular repeat protein